MDVRHSGEWQQLNQCIDDQQPLSLLTEGTLSQRKALLSELTKEHAVKHPILHINSHKALDPKSINDLFRQQCNLSPDNTTSLEHQLQAILDSLTTQRKRCILVAEEAQKLPFSVLAAFVHLALQQEQNKQVCLHIILAGETELFDKMKQLTQADSLHCIRLQTHDTTLQPSLEIPQLTTSVSATATTAGKSFWKNHVVKITSWSLLLILSYVIWQGSFYRHPSHLSQQPIQMAPAVQHTATTRPAPQKPLTQQAATTQETAAQSQTATPTQPKIATKNSTKIIMPTTKKHTAYTIQLASSHDKHALKKLQQTLTISNSHILEIIQNNSFRFVLLTGNYDTMALAKQAQQQLPASLKKNHPWIRTVKSYPKTMLNTHKSQPTPEDHL